MPLGSMTGRGSTDPRAGSTAPIGYDPAYGGIPNLPPYTTDTATTVGTDVQQQMLQNLPGYQQMVSGDVGNIQRNLAGQVAPDVINLMQQQAAERGIQTGMPGAPAGDAAYLRALGLTSLQLQQLGHTQLNEAMARTPIQQRQTTTTTRDLGAERAIYASAPNPRAAAEQALRNAQLGMGAGANAAGANRPGGYTLNPAAPRGATQQMGYQDPLAAEQAWANQWAQRYQTPEYLASQQAELDRQRAWDAAHPFMYPESFDFANAPATDLYAGYGAAPAGSYYSPSTDQSVAPGFGPGGYGDYGYDIPDVSPMDDLSSMLQQEADYYGMYD